MDKTSVLISKLYEQIKALDVIQNALDVAGLDPTNTIGTVADGTNALISLLRAAAAKESNEQKKHLINAGVSAISIVPFGDIVKGLKYSAALGKAARPAAKTAAVMGKGLRAAAHSTKLQGDRFE